MHTAAQISTLKHEIDTNIVHEQCFKVYATVSKLKYSFDELKAVSVIGIWNNEKKKKKKEKRRRKIECFPRMSKT